MDVRVDYKESWAPKNWCFWTVVLEKTLESPLDCKEIQPAHSKGDQPWVFFGRNDVKAQHSENEDHGIWSHHFMEIDGETVETVADFIFGGSKITAVRDCSQEIKDAYSLEGQLCPT